MPYVPNTPESKAALIGRSDSRNPATTCRGISVSTGKCCRRAASSKPSQANLPNEDLFCWQHKDQAADAVLLKHSASQKERRLRGRTSLDTLVEVIVGPTEETDEGEVGMVTMKRTSSVGSFQSIVVRKNSTALRKGRTKGQKVVDTGRQSHARLYGERREPRKQAGPPDAGKPVRLTSYTQPSLLSQLFCCMRPQPYSVMTEKTDEDGRNARKSAERRRTNSAHQQHVTFSQVSRPPPPQNGSSRARRPVHLQTIQQSSSGSSSSEGETTKLPNGANSLTPKLPLTLSCETRAQLLAEVSKPISHKDQDGYIYVFWLRDGSAGSPNGPSLEESGSERSVAPLLNASVAAAEKSGDTEKRTLLKIGRANNVQRRLHQWSTQCGYDLSLIRYYPHTSLSASSSSVPSSSTVGRKVPFSHRVERLIHIELRDANFNAPHKCQTCQTVHKEWFSVPASRQGLAKVDEIVKRWVEWAEGVSCMMEGGSASVDETDEDIQVLTGIVGSMTVSADDDEDDFQPSSIRNVETIYHIDSQPHDGRSKRDEDEVKAMRRTGRYDAGQQGKRKEVRATSANRTRNELKEDAPYPRIVC